MRELTISVKHFFQENSRRKSSFVDFLECSREVLLSLFRKKITEKKNCFFFMPISISHALLLSDWLLATMTHDRIIIIWNMGKMDFVSFLLSVLFICHVFNANAIMASFRTFISRFNPVLHDARYSTFAIQFNV